MDASSVEECWRILRQSGKSIGYESLAHVPEYSAWLEKQDWTDAYQRHKANLQLIGLNDQELQWVLKNPSHLVGLDAIMSRTGTTSSDHGPTARNSAANSSQKKIQPKVRRTAGV